MDSDPDIEFIEKDSGMSSLGGSKDETPERRAFIEDIEDEHEEREEREESGVVMELGPRGDAPEPTETYDDEPDETFGERVWGLTEMLPESVRGVIGTATDASIKTTKALYSFTCSASWIFFTSSMILFAPILCEVELAQMEELQRSQQKQVLLGPGSAISAAGGAPSMPPLSR